VRPPRDRVARAASVPRAARSPARDLHPADRSPSTFFLFRSIVASFDRSIDRPAHPPSIPPPPPHPPAGQSVRVATPARALRPRAAASLATPCVAKLEKGDKVKVTSSVTVYHVLGMKGAAVDLNGMEGEVHSRADDLDGVYISANLEVKIQFPIPGNDKGKMFIAHMKEDEVEKV
jgi:hypothetical protein